MVKIAVIGCGAIGLTSALEIQKKLGNIAKVTIFADKFSPDTTSDIAAGLWEPYLCGDHTTEEITGWARHTYDCIVKLWKEGKAKEAGIILQPNITLIDQEPFIIPEWLTASMGYSELTDHHLKSLNKQYKKKIYWWICIHDLYMGGSNISTLFAERISQAQRKDNRKARKKF